MDEDAKEILRIGAEVALHPAVKVLDDLIGVLGGDSLSEYREKQKRRRAARNEETIDRTAQILDERKVKKIAEFNDEATVEVLEAAQDEGRQELRELWARLLAASLDPARVTRYRREFIEIAKRLEPVDAEILPFLAEPGQLAPNRRAWVAGRTSRSDDEIVVSFRSLAVLGLIESPYGPNGNHQLQPILSSLGREFLFCVRE